MSIGLGVASPLGAQESLVAGTVTDPAGQPAASVLVALEDSEGRDLQRMLTDGSGRFRLSVPGPGLYRIRADRMGYRTMWTDTFQVVGEEVVRLDIRLSLEPVELEGLEVEVQADEGPCVLSPEEGSVLSDVWGQARQVFGRIRATREEAAFRFSLRRYRRSVEILTARVMEERWQNDWDSTEPFRAPPAPDLVEHGWVRSEGQSGVDYYGLTPETLLSDAFEEAHCLRLRQDAERPREVGLGFEPTGPSRIPGIRGTLWVDRESARLREVTFHYTRHLHDPEIPEGLLELFGGEIRFRELPGGRWVVDRWVLRMPSFRGTDAEAPPPPDRRDPDLVRHLDRIRTTVDGLPSWWWRNQIEQGLLVFYQEGGELARIEWPDTLSGAGWSSSAVGGGGDGAGG